jgi:hypothetical protein
MKSVLREFFRLLFLAKLIRSLLPISSYYILLLIFALTYILGPKWQSQILKSIPTIDETAPNNASTNEYKIPPAQQGETEAVGADTPLND